MTPNTILIMRHAEKPAEKGDIHLASPGVQRAQRLATYIPKTFGQPNFIFATQQSPDSNRPVETVQPLSNAIGVPIDSSFANDQYKTLADHVATDPKYNGALVLICWHHEKIPKLALHLGAPASGIPDPWNPDVYNLILVLDFSPGPSPSVSKNLEPF
jgi:hypothetical protein